MNLYAIAINQRVQNRFQSDKRRGHGSWNCEKVTPPPAADPDPKSSPPDISVKFLPSPNHNLRPLAFYHSPNTPKNRESICLSLRKQRSISLSSFFPPLLTLNGEYAPPSTIFFFSTASVPKLRVPIYELGMDMESIYADMDGK
jgi:hypothetical protein